MTYEQYCQAMIAYAKSIQGENYPGDEYYTQDCWKDHFAEGMMPKESVDGDMSYWDPV